MKLRNLISAGILVGLGTAAVPAAAVVLTSPPTEVPPNCHVTASGPPLPFDVRGNLGIGLQRLYFVTCSTPQPPSWLRW